MDMQHIMHNIDKVYLITSFAENDNPERLGLCKTAQETIARFLPCEHMRVSSLDEWDKVWMVIKDDCAKGIIPLIHLAMHGEIEGIRVQGFNKPYQWSELLDCFEKIDNLCNHQLHVFMQVCHGAQCLFDLLNREEPPFSLMIASPDEINIGNTFDSLKYFYEKASTSTLHDAIYTYIEKNKLSESFWGDKKYRWCLLKKEGQLPNNLFACLITSNIDDWKKDL